MTSKIAGSCNFPLESCNASMPSPFFNATVLQKQWRELDATFTSDYISTCGLSGRNIYVICYNGDTARVATSVLRVKGISASSIKGGIAAVRKELPNLHITENARYQEDLKTAKIPDIVVKELRADSPISQVEGLDVLTSRLG